MNAYVLRKACFLYKRLFSVPAKLRPVLEWIKVFTAKTICAIMTQAIILSDCPYAGMERPADYGKPV